jgi:hypothetical protein
VSEVGGTSTDLNNYVSETVCRDNNGTGPVVAEGGPTVSVTINQGDDIVCTITNTRRDQVMQSAPYVSVSLVPVFRQCGTGANPVNGRHSPPLGTGSCLPPSFGSGQVAHFGDQASTSASVQAQPGDPNTPGNQADVYFQGYLSDVRSGSATGADYDPDPSGPDIRLVERWRLTDYGSGPSGSDRATTTDFDFPVPADCVETVGDPAGSDCYVSTSANAVTPGSIQENARAVIQLFRVRVQDSGANALLGDADDRLFAQQGFYVP